MKRNVKNVNPMPPVKRSAGAVNNLFANIKSKLTTILLFMQMLILIGAFYSCKDNTNKQDTEQQGGGQDDLSSGDDILESINDLLSETIQIMLDNGDIYFSENGFYRANILALSRNPDLAYRIYQELKLPERTKFNVSKEQLPKGINEKELIKRLRIIFPDDNIIHMDLLDYAKDGCWAILLPISMDLQELLKEHLTKNNDNTQSNAGEKYTEGTQKITGGSGEAEEPEPPVQKVRQTKGGR